ncbi:hypothetical protein RV10_GL003670 [Enterococcus pallens]|nr:hypothetical protein RV10_GL003670 [Enterococcus pallens]
MVLTNKLPEPSYEDTRPQSFYREEMIALMNLLHDEEIKNLKAQYEKEVQDDTEV